MRIQTHVTNLTEPEKKQFDAYLEQKLKRITEWIKSHYPDVDTVKLDVHMVKHEKHTAFECEFVLNLPRTQSPLIAREVKHSVTEPMDAVTSKLEAQLSKHFKKLTRE